MFNIGGGELLVILLLGLLVLGPERLPKAIGQVGRYVAQLRSLSSGFQDEIRRAMDPTDAPFRPGEEKAHSRPVDEEVRVVGIDPPTDDETPDEVIDVTAEDGDPSPDGHGGDQPDPITPEEDHPQDQVPAAEPGVDPEIHLGDDEGIDPGDLGDVTTADPRPSPRLDGPAPAAPAAPATPGRVTPWHGRADGDAQAAR